MSDRPEDLQKRAYKDLPSSIRLAAENLASFAVEIADREVIAGYAAAASLKAREEAFEEAAVMAEMEAARMNDHGWTALKSFASAIRHHPQKGEK